QRNRGVLGRTRAQGRGSSATDRKSAGRLERNPRSPARPATAVRIGPVAAAGERELQWRHRARPVAASTGPRHCSVQDVGLAGAEDPDVLAWAAANNRLALTHDRATMWDYAKERVR